jgi:hypothetical protein
MSFFYPSNPRGHQDILPAVQYHLTMGSFLGYNCQIGHGDAATKPVPPLAIGVGELNSLANSVFDYNYPKQFLLSNCATEIYENFVHVDLELPPTQPTST